MGTNRVDKFPSPPFYPAKKSNDQRNLRFKFLDFPEECKEEDEGKDMELKNLKLYLENQSIVEENEKLRKKANLLHQENLALMSSNVQFLVRALPRQPYLAINRGHYTDLETQRFLGRFSVDLYIRNAAMHIVALHKQILLRQKWIYVMSNWISASQPGSSFSQIMVPSRNTVRTEEGYACDIEALNNKEQKRSAGRRNGLSGSFLGMV
ncbi:hypothetical protein GH714_029344 [Hevea brasiliensis]|uniref:Uncharacterized protein n=1 Tax=Hevea brasiliensis TaxID=3981 RepID=A0A6A6LEG0_HEVBR|nr:hypothetical protein GH714_029344 [Hevea brasiliensis]